MKAELEKVVLKIRAADPCLSAQNMLNAVEHERLAGMHEGARPTFVTARGMLRQALGDHMGLLASSVPLYQEGTGRIYLDGFRGDEPPFYSVSHTGSAEDGIAAIAVSDTSPIGIDVQQLDPIANWQRIAERRFPPEEWMLLSAMPEAEGRMLFFTLWAIKESFVKMEDGKLMPYLRDVELDLSSGRPMLKGTSPGGNSAATIYFHFVPEQQLVIALVSAKPVDVLLDCEIRPPSRRTDPLMNRGGE